MKQHWRLSLRKLRKHLSMLYASLVMLPMFLSAEPVFTVIDADGNGKQTVSVSGASSFDPDGQLIDYAWKINDVVVASGYGPTVQNLSYDFSLGTTTILLSVRDDTQVSISTAAQVIVLPQSQSSNNSPVVSAGADISITFPASASLTGVVSDDGLPNPPSALTTAWSKISGPGTANFDSASSVLTTVNFSTAGVYVLRLNATDGSLTSSDDLTVTVQNSVSPQGIENYGYVSKYEKKSVDPNGVYKEFGGIAFNPVTQHMYLVDNTSDVIVETGLDGTILRVIDVSSFRKDPDPSAGAKAITWMGGESLWHRV